MTAIGEEIFTIYLQRMRLYSSRAASYRKGSHSSTLGYSRLLKPLPATRKYSADTVATRHQT